MAIPTTIALVVSLNFLLGVGVALATVKLQETTPLLTPLPAIGIGGLAIYGQMYIGDLLNPTVPSMKIQVIAAVGSALVGMLSVFLSVQPEK